MDSLGGTREVLGRQERINWIAYEAPGRQEREHGRDQWDSLRGTRKAGKD